MTTHLDHNIENRIHCPTSLWGIPLRVIAIFLVTATATPSMGQEVHHDLCLYGCPSGASITNDLIVRDIYVLSSNDITKFADWVAYSVTKETIGPSQSRTWKADPELSDDETLEPNDYRGANGALNTDRGHQAPLASFSATDSWHTTNYLSNITPQKSALNQGPWKNLEDAVRTLANTPETESVYVFTGPLYERNMPRLPEADESHLVPSGYWKIIATETDGDLKIAAFIFDQETPRRTDYCAEEFVIDVRTIEDRTGLNFFHGLDATYQDAIETAPSTLLQELGCSI